MGNFCAHAQTVPLFFTREGFKDTDEKHGSLPGPAILGMTCLMMKTMHVTKHLAVTNGC